MATTPWGLVLEVLERQHYARAKRELETAAEPEKLPRTPIHEMVKEVRREMTRRKLEDQGKMVGGR